MIIIVILGGALFMYGLYYKPEYIAALLFMLIVANINIDLNGLPLNTRAIVTLALFGRILMDKKSLQDYPLFVRNSLVVFFFIFNAYILFISFGQDLFTMDLFKLAFSNFLCVFIAYHYFFKEKGARMIKLGMTLSGIICFADLAYTYIAFGTFPVQRLCFLFTSNPVEGVDPNDVFNSPINHNFFGQICGMGFVYAITDFVKNKSNDKFMLLILPFMFMGVLMSTSRSALLGMLLVSLLVMMTSMSMGEERKKVFRIVVFIVGAAFAGIILFSILGTYIHIDSSFLEHVVYRLTDEPIAMIKRAMGQNYNIQNLDSMDWREEAAANAFNAFMDLPVREQFFGIGSGGFIARDLGHGLNPHNGILLILIEDGIVGFMMYLLIIFGVIIQALRLRNISPSLAVVVFILIYGVGQNEELTSVTTFLFVFTVIAENQFLIAENKRKFFEYKEARKARLNLIR